MAMRKAEMLLGCLAAALALVALVASLTQQAVKYVSKDLPDGRPGILWADPIRLNATSAPVMLVGAGALLLCLGTVIDARVHKRSRVALLAMMMVGAIFCAGAFGVTSLANLSLYAEHLAYDPSQPLPPAEQFAQIPHVSLALFYAPVAVVGGLCALVALPRHQSRSHHA